MAEILGGGSKFCDAMQYIANTAEGWEDKDWDAWNEAYMAHCSS